MDLSLAKIISLGGKLMDDSCSSSWSSRIGCSVFERFGSLLGLKKYSAVIEQSKKVPQCNKALNENLEFEVLMRTY